MRAAVVVGCALLLAACGGPTQTNAGGAPAQPLPPRTSAPPTSESSGPSKCVTTDVRGEFGSVTAVDTSTNEASIVVTNTGRRTCTLHGYGGLDLHSGGSVLPLELTREAQPAQETVTVKPGQKAYKKLVWAVPGPDGDKTGCVDSASYADVTLPDDTKTFEAHPADGSEDLGPVCGGVLHGYAWSATDQTQ